MQHLLLVFSPNRATYWVGGIDQAQMQDKQLPPSKLPLQT